jgi:hypothetical protein
MSYRDVYELRFKNFDQVLKVVNETKPYRGTTNVYPLGNRRYNDRTFTFHGDHIVIRYGLKEVLKFHKDDSVEFLHDNYNQGPNMMVSAFLYPHTVKNDSRMDGTVIHSYYSNADRVTVHPVFKGLRVYLADLKLHPTVKYKMIYKTVDRKKSKELRKQWEERLKTVKAFFLVSDSEQMIQESRELGNKIAWAGKDLTMDADTYSQFLYIARLLGLMRLSRDFGRWRRQPCIDTDREVVFKKTKERFFYTLYNSSDVDVFEWKEVEEGAKAPAGNWGVKVNYEIKEAV